MLAIKRLPQRGSPFAAAVLFSCVAAERAPVAHGDPAASGEATSQGPAASAAPSSIAASSAAPSSPVAAEELPLRWNCDAPPRAAVQTPDVSKVVRFPSEGQQLEAAALSKQLVLLTLPHLQARPWVALDHHAARPAAPRLRFAQLLSEWDVIGSGEHRLVVFWVDDRGLVVQGPAGAALLAMRHFQVNSGPKLPLEDWLWVGPSGTWNGKANDAVGHPFGLTLLHWGGQPAELELEVTSRGMSRRTSLGPATCSLRVAQSGDYTFRIARGDERVERTLSVNLDLGE
jgi:hypothetical protein